LAAAAAPLVAAPTFFSALALLPALPAGLALTVALMSAAGCFALLFLLVAIRVVNPFYLHSELA
jgi:hypothetical protein